MAMNFNMSQTTGAVESKGGLTPGIHKATFKGLKKDTLTSQNGDVFNVMTLMLDIEGFGEFKHNFFEPKSNERKESQWGLNASQLDHFMISVRQIIDALDPEIGKRIDSGELKLGGTFAQLVNGVAKELEGFVGTEVEVKLIPNNGFNSIPGFPAKINRNGTLGIATRFIGHDLVLSTKEQKLISDVQKAKPTNMAAVKGSNADILDDLTSELGVDDSTDSDDDLPF